MQGTKYFFTDEDGETDVASEKPRSGRRTLGQPSTVLAALTLESALRRERDRVRRPGTLALVLEAPDASWVAPLADACKRLSHWDGVIARDGASRANHRPEIGNSEVVEVLASGGRMLGVAPAPRRHLPAALVNSADLTVVVPRPSSELLARVVRTCTGRVVRDLPPGLGATLSFGEIVAAVRVGSSPRKAVARLSAAAAAKIVADPGVADATPFEELRGYGEETRAWGMELITSVEAWRRGEIATRDVAGRAIVLAGPPGTGKTTMARSLAKSTGTNFLLSSVGNWFSSSSGNLDGVVKAIDALVASAVALSPCLVLLDECEALPSRAGMDARDLAWWSPVVAHCLVQIEALLADQRALVCVVAATNYPERLDPALVRPGRLDRIVTVGRPTEADLAVILRQHLRSDLPDLDLSAIARLGSGSTGAVAAAWVRTARARALLARRPMLAADLLDVVAPPETRSSREIRIVATHEAGHAVVAEALLGVGSVRVVSTVLRGDSGGRTVRELSVDEGTATREAIERHVVALLAGRAAEVVLLGCPTSAAGGAPRSDLARATALASAAHASLGLGGSLVYRGTPAGHADLLALDPTLANAVAADLDRLNERAERLVADHAEAIRTVADRLVAERILTGEALRAILADHGRPPPAP